MNKGSDIRGNKVEYGRPLLLKLIQAGVVTESDVAELRRDIFVERPPSRIDIEDIFALDAVARPTHEAWLGFLIDVATDFFVWDQRPTGYLAEADARWLLARLDATQTPARFALLVNILDEAHQVPRWFPQAVRGRAAAGAAECVERLDRAA